MKKILTALGFLILALVPASAQTSCAIGVYCPRPGSDIYDFAFNTPTAGIELVCGGPGLSSPFGCTLPNGAVYGVLPQPGNGGDLCVDPQPTICYQPSNGVLGFTIPGPAAMALVTAQTFSNQLPLSFASGVTFYPDCTQPVAYAGIVIYDGEGAATDPTGNYRALYFLCGDGLAEPTITLWVYSPSIGYKIASAGSYAAGQAYNLRIDWTPGVSFQYFLNYGLVFTETPGSISKDPFIFSQWVHLGLWTGSSYGTFFATNAYR